MLVAWHPKSGETSACQKNQFLQSNSLNVDDTQTLGHFDT